MKWNRWWVLMWFAIAGFLLISAFYMPFWHWTTLAVFAFGVPEWIGCEVKNDAFPPLTQVIIHYLHPEIGMPLIFFFAGAIGAYWLGFTYPLRLGALVGFIGWLTAHFLPRWFPRL